jgi:cellulose biosynthesis protein BcsQ
MVLTIASMKGGVGKTSIATMMARYISNKRSSPVVVIDMDPQRAVLPPSTVFSINDTDSGLPFVVYLSPAGSKYELDTQ